jgi:lipoate-protein ligase B
VAFHGMSFNVNLDLSGFQTIVPCGLVGQPVASMKTILGDACPSMEAVRDRLLANFSSVCERELEIFQTLPALRQLEGKKLPAELRKIIFPS